MLQSMIDKNEDNFVYDSDKDYELYMIEMNVNWSDEKKNEALNNLFSMLPTKDAQTLNKD